MVTKALELSLPTQTKAATNGFDPRPREVAQWVAGLPMANAVEAAHRLRDALYETNRTPLPGRRRMTLLETLREPILQLTPVLQKQFVGAALPLADKGHRVATLLQDLHGELALGYKTAAVHGARRNFLFRDNRLLMLAIHRALAGLGRVMLTAYQTYAPLPPGLWQDLHRLYAYAQAKRLHRVSLDDPSHRLAAKTTISTEYKRLALLSLACPYRMRPGEAEKVYVNLERWAPEAHLYKPGQTPTTPAGYFGCFLDHDQPPGYLVLGKQDCQAHTCRILNTQAVGKLLREAIARNEAETLSTVTGIDKQTHQLSSELMRRLMLAWGVMPKRSFSRQGLRDKALVTLGLSAVHHFVAQGAESRGPAGQSPGTVWDESLFDAPAHFTSAPVRHISDPVRDVWELTYPMDVSGPVLKENIGSLGSTRADGVAADNPHGAHIWRLVNESAGGCCLVSQHAGEPNVAVGDLIGVLRAAEHGPGAWSVGVVRWLKTGPGHDLQLGIQMLTPHAVAGAIRVPGRGRDAQSYHRCLLLPALPTIGQPASLLTPSVPYRAGSRLDLLLDDGVVQVQLTKAIENTGLFAQFHFELLSRAAGAPPAQFHAG